MALIRIINKARIQRDEPVQPVRPVEPVRPDKPIPAIPVPIDKGPLLWRASEIISARDSCEKGYVYEFLRNYEGPMAFGITNDSKVSGKIVIGENVDYPNAQTIVKNFSYEDRGTELINISVKKGYKLKLKMNGGEFMKHEGQNKPAKCGTTTEEVIAKGVNHTTYRIGFGDEGQYGGEFDTSVYIPKPAKPPEIPTVVAPERPKVIAVPETSGGGGGSSDNHDLPSASSGATDGANPGGYGGLNIDSFY